MTDGLAAEASDGGEDSFVLREPGVGIGGRGEGAVVGFQESGAEEEVDVPLGAAGRELGDGGGVRAGGEDAGGAEGGLLLEGRGQLEAG